MSILVEIKRSLTQLLKSNFLGYEIYAEEVPTIKDGDKFGDYFFVELVPASVTTLNKYQTKHNVLITIMCQTSRHNNEEYFNIASKVDDIIRPYVEFDGRKITVDNAEYKVVDRILRYKFSLNFIDSKEMDESYPTMEDFERRVY